MKIMFLFQKCCERVSTYIVTAHEKQIDVTLNFGNIPPCIRFYINNVGELTLRLPPHKKTNNNRVSRFNI